MACRDLSRKSNISLGWPTVSFRLTLTVLKFKAREITYVHFPVDMKLITSEYSCFVTLPQSLGSSRIREFDGEYSHHTFT